MTHIEETIVTQLIDMLAAAGWQLRSGFDGEEEEPVTTYDEAMAFIQSVDECWLHFYNEQVGTTHGVFFTPGNGVDIIADYTYSATDGFDDVLQNHGAWVERRFL